MSNENEKNIVEVEDKAIDQIARFFVLVARDLESEERKTGVPALPINLVKKAKSYEKQTEQQKH